MRYKLQEQNTDAAHKSFGVIFTFVCFIWIWREMDGQAESDSWWTAGDENYLLFHYKQVKVSSQCWWKESRAYRWAEDESRNASNTLAGDEMLFFSCLLLCLLLSTIREVVLGFLMNTRSAWKQIFCVSHSHCLNSHTGALHTSCYYIVIDNYCERELNKFLFFLVQHIQNDNHINF